MLRYRPDNIPVERKSFSGLFFLLGVVSLIVAGWVFFNEFETRRPYKKYQRDFYALETTRLTAQVDDLARQLRNLGQDPDDIEPILSPQTSLSAAEIDALARQMLKETYAAVETFNNVWAEVRTETADGKLSPVVIPRNFTEEEFQNALTVADLERMRAEEDRKLRVQKSLRDAEYYQYSHERHADDPSRQYEGAVEMREAVVQPRENVIQAMTTVADAMRIWLADFQKRKGGEESRRMAEHQAKYSGDISALAADLSYARDQLSLVDHNVIEMLNDFGRVKRVGIQQQLLGNHGSEMNDVDRCQSCHIAAAKEGYEWWIDMTAVVTESREIALAEPDPDDPELWIARQGQAIGNARQMILNRPIQEGELWNDPLVYIDDEPFYPRDGFSFSKWTIDWSGAFADAYLTQGRVVKVYQAYPTLYQSHPNRAELFAAHPPERFGCVSCHAGQGRALTWEDAGCDFREDPHNPNSPTHWWEEPMLTSLRSKDELRGKERFKAHESGEWSVKELAEKLNLPASDLVEYDAEWFTEALYRKKSHFHPNVNNEPIGDFAETNCAHCHSETLELDMAPTLSKGKRLFERLGCAGCHFVSGYEERVVYDPEEDYMEHRRMQVGPSLSYDKQMAQLTQAAADPELGGFGWKLNENGGKEWLFNWLKNPRSYLPETRMPNYRFSDDEAKALTAFILKGTGWTEDAAVEEPALDAAKVARGEALTKNIGCLSCHTAPDADGEPIGNTFGPDLSRAGSKLSRKFLLKWLANPRAYDPKTIMPSMFDNLQEPEKTAQIEAVAEYLLSLNDRSWIAYDGGDFEITDELVKEGERLFGPSGKGCVGCHFIEAEMPAADGGVRMVGGREWVGQQIGAELSDLAAKTPEFLDYGFANHRAVVYYGDRSDLRYGELVKKSKDGSVQVRVPAEDGAEGAVDPLDWKGLFYKTDDQVKTITLSADEPKSIAKIHSTWHDWVFHKIKEPNIYSTEANASAQNMPNFYLSDDEAAALLVLLRSFDTAHEPSEEYQDRLTEREKRIERGRALTIRYNCVGCHAIEESFATRGGRLYKGWASGGHTRDHEAMPRYAGPDGEFDTLDDIQKNGWAVPERGYGLSLTIQPSYDGARPNAGARAEPIQIQAEDIVQNGLSNGPFSFDTVGNPFSYMRAGYPVDGARIQHGPVLTFAGERFRTEWMFEFLKRPYPVREYLFDLNQGRMPYFQLTDEEASDIVSYFAALANEPYPYEVIEDEAEPALVRLGSSMYEAEAGCSTGECHPASGDLSPKYAPDLRHSTRLKPRWIKAWVTNPEDFWPGSGMPKFPWINEADGSPLYPQYGEVDQLMSALRDYVLTLGE